MNNHLIYVAKATGKMYPGKNGKIDLNNRIEVDLTLYRKKGENEIFNIYEPRKEHIPKHIKNEQRTSL